MMIITINLMVLLKQTRHFLKKVKKEVEMQKEEAQEKEVIHLIAIQKRIRFVCLLPLIEIEAVLQNLLDLED